jgi:hypothetical protein
MDDRRFMEVLRDDPDTSAFLDNITPEESRRVGAELIKEQAERRGISEAAALHDLALTWIALRRLALETYPRLAEHLHTLIKMCD